jgi:predicted transcriptional regulator
MEYSKLKEELHQIIDQVNDEAALYQVRSILESQTGHDWADDMSDELREALERSIAQADAGNVISHEEVMKMLREKYGQ